MGLARVGSSSPTRTHIVYPQALAPSSAASRPTASTACATTPAPPPPRRAERVAEIVAICKANGYGYVFAGYGFMAESADSSEALESAGLVHGPQLAHPAGRRVEGRGPPHRARAGTSASPRRQRHHRPRPRRQAPTNEALAARRVVERLSVSLDGLAREDALEAVPRRRTAPASTSSRSTRRRGREGRGRIFAERPGARVRIKAIGGGGGKNPAIVTDASAVPRRCARPSRR